MCSKDLDLPTGIVADFGRSSTSSHIKDDLGELMMEKRRDTLGYMGTGLTVIDLVIRCILICKAIMESSVCNKNVGSSRDNRIGIRKGNCFPITVYSNSRVDCSSLRVEIDITGLRPIIIIGR